MKSTEIFFNFSQILSRSLTIDEIYRQTGFTETPSSSDTMQIRIEIGLIFRRRSDR